MIIAYDTVFSEKNIVQYKKNCSEIHIILFVLCIYHKILFCDSSVLGYFTCTVINVYQTN